MDELDRFEQLAARAAQEPSPEPDVTLAVQARIAARPIPVPSPAVAAACCAMAALALLVAWPAWQAVNDPWVGWLVGLQAGWLL